MRGRQRPQRPAACKSAQGNLARLSWMTLEADNSQTSLVVVSAETASLVGALPNVSQSRSSITRPRSQDQSVSSARRAAGQFRAENVDAWSMRCGDAPATLAGLAHIAAAWDQSPWEDGFSGSHGTGGSALRSLQGGCVEKSVLRPSLQSGSSILPA